MDVVDVEYQSYRSYMFMITGSTTDLTLHLSGTFISVSGSRVSRDGPHFIQVNGQGAIRGLNLK